ncbi:jg24016 [Pararge aegeria aegeria]|uniref:Jg24016 protein n=1 Tax=Pararge aegeria aegeria TaxID=348720 RepID=A0A8S4SKQ0_9NEOP|nr:jg24016 [Pararge aegeria aegeria]
MERYERADKRHSKHHKEKHKKRSHKKYRSHSGTHEQSYATSNSVKPLVEYSDVSSEDLSAPEAGEIESEASSIGRHIADDLDRTRKSHSIRTFLDNKISVTTTSRRAAEEYTLTRDSSSAARKRRGVEYQEPVPEFEDLHYKKKKEKRKKEKKKRKRKSKHRSRTASLESVSPDDNVPAGTPMRAVTPQRYTHVPISEWEKASSPLRNGSCSPVSPSTPPLMRQHDVSPLHRSLHREPSLLNALPFSPRRERSPIVRRRQKSTTPHTPLVPPYHETVTIDSDNDDYEHSRREYWHEPHRVSNEVMIISDSPVHEGRPREYSPRRHRRRSPRRRRSRERERHRDRTHHRRWSCAGGLWSRDILDRIQRYRSMPARWLDSIGKAAGENWMQLTSYPAVEENGEAKSSRLKCADDDDEIPPMSHSRSSLKRRRTRSRSRRRSSSPPRHRARHNEASKDRHRSKHESPSPPSTVLQRKIDFKEKISDTSLFAELVKDKHKRAKKLQEILEQKEESQGAASSSASMSNNPETLTIDELSNTTADSFTPQFPCKENGEYIDLKPDVVDIPMPIPPPSDGESDSVPEPFVQPMEPLPPPPPAPPDIAMPTANGEATDSSNLEPPPKPFTPPPAVPSSAPCQPLPPPPKFGGSVVEAVYITSQQPPPPKPRSLTKLPMPPNTQVDDLKTLANESPLSTPSSSPVKKPEKPKRTGIMNLPMPPG